MVHACSVWLTREVNEDSYFVSLLLATLLFAINMKHLALLLLLLAAFSVACDRRTYSQSTAAPTPSPVASPPAKEPEHGYLYPNSILPKHFQDIDFKNYAYRSDRNLDGWPIDFRLTNGEYEFEGGWVSLSNVYYADLTGDNLPEAIVMLSVVHCGGSCDGGSARFYVYEARKRCLQQIWEYETGSLAYGCGLKSFAAKPKQIVMELFGRCRKPKQESPGRGKFLIEDMTRVSFKFNG
ncbi:MAG TPA: hypothetical protein VJS17_08115, partial [Pyrinomonadaceae bacterium]|nr:hypothetical protein [Pyrinomonadaceae bacterium]